MKKLVLAGAFCVIAACETAGVSSGAAAPEPGENEAGNESGPIACPVLASRNWHAWIDRMPGPDGGARLNVSGEVDLPTPGYSASWTVGPTDRRNPPGQRLGLAFAPPEGIVSQVLVTEQLQFQMETAITEYRVVLIGCGDEAVAEITEIMTVN